MKRKTSMGGMPDSNAPMKDSRQNIHGDLLRVAQSNMPLVSIITAVKNSGRDLERTINSVISQSYENIEYIIIDGGSTDSTLDIIKKYDDHITYWISEPDSGISDAFNKGITRSAGTWINFLNAGDVFTDRHIVERLSRHFLGEYIITAFVKHKETTIPKYVHTNSEPISVKSMISHQGSFIKKSVFDDVGTFSKEFTIRMDYEFWLRALKKYDFYFIDEVMVDYLAGISSNNIKRYYQEEILANRKHHVSWYFSMKACLKYIIKKYILMYG